MTFKNTLFSIFMLAVSSGISAEHRGEEIYKADYNTFSISKVLDDTVTYTVISGDTAYSIARRHGISVKELFTLNPGAESGLKTGMTLRIPKKLTSYKKHKIEAKETFYSVGRKYSISVNDIKAANKGLDEKSFKVGKEIKIPVYNNGSVIATNEKQEKQEEYGNPFIEHKVVRGETLYSIGKEYGVSIETLFNQNEELSQGLKVGMTLRIPRKYNAQPIRQVQESNAIAQNEPSIKSANAKDKTMRVGILFPFVSGDASLPNSRIVEYYNGFLLAIKDLKEKGYDAEVYTFDIGSGKDTKKLEGLLDTYDMKNLNLIIGGVSKSQIDVLTRFSKKTGIKYVIPFDSKAESAILVPSVFRMTTSPSSLYQDITKNFIDRFKGYNILFVAESGSDNNKTDFTGDLNKALTSAKISFKDVSYTNDLLSDLKTAASGNRNIIIPTSSSEASLKRIVSAINEIPENNYTLFGYPEWQTYTGMYKDLYKYNSYIYSIFFLDEAQYKVKEIEEEYKQWYNKPLSNSYPKFGYLGYDTGIYFMTAINKYGSSFEDKLSSFNVPTLQSAIRYERKNDKVGYINTGLYFIRFKENSTIEKVSINK